MAKEDNIKNVIGKLFKQYRLEPKLYETRLRENWEKLMGKAIANYTKQVYLKHGRLTMIITSAPLKNDLMYSREKIKEVINTELGQDVVTEVIIK